MKYWRAYILEKWSLNKCFLTQLRSLRKTSVSRSWMQRNFAKELSLNKICIMLLNMGKLIWNAHHWIQHILLIITKAISHLKIERLSLYASICIVREICNEMWWNFGRTFVIWWICNMKILTQNNSHTNNRSPTAYHSFMALLLPEWPSFFDLASRD